MQRHLILACPYFSESEFTGSHSESWTRAFDTHRATLGAMINVHSHAITTVSGVVHGVRRVLDRPVGSGGRIAAVVLGLRILWNRVIRASDIRWPVVADREIVRPIMIPDRVRRIVMVGRITDATNVRGPMSLVAMRGPAGPYRVAVNVYVVVHVWLLMPEIYGKCWAT